MNTLKDRKKHIETIAQWMNKPTYTPSSIAKNITPRTDGLTNSHKVVNLEEAILRSGLRDGMTISFHHHFRGGDKVVNMVVD